MDYSKQEPQLEVTCGACNEWILRTRITTVKVQFFFKFQCETSDKRTDRLCDYYFCLGTNHPSYSVSKSKMCEMKFPENTEVLGDGL